MYCRTKYNLSRGDVELCPTSTDFVEWRLTRNISICIMLFFVELRASKNITLSNQQNISFCNQRNRTICPCPIEICFYFYFRGRTTFLIPTLILTAPHGKKKTHHDCRRSILQPNKSEMWACATNAFTTSFFNDREKKLWRLSA